MTYDGFFFRLCRYYTHRRDLIKMKSFHDSQLAHLISKNTAHSYTQTDIDTKRIKFIPGERTDRLTKVTLLYGIYITNQPHVYHVKRVLIRMLRYF